LKNRELRLFFLIFAASGFAGLIYESIWSHYLKLFLGHAAYAQALVLAVFMGGMALGALLCSKYSDRVRNLLIGYALVEAIIGIGAVLFHPLYVRFIDIAYLKLIPALGSPAAVAIFKWTAATLLILPQSVLLGTTFPLMTAGLLRRFPRAPGAVVAMLYFTNSIGAAIGVLASGFLFIGWVGLPGTLVIAGFINITIAAIVFLECKRIPDMQSEDHPAADTTLPDTTPPFVYAVFLLIALLTGLSSFIYEIGWIRMLSLVLGSSTHSFELMLSAFIMGLAFGSLWIKRRIDSLEDPRRFLSLVQIAMGILALATLPVYGSTFTLMSWLIRHLPKTELGYALFNLSSQGIALSIMLPAAICAGMTLPLITAALLRNGAGERSIGAVYGYNTIGAILGVFIAIHLAMPLLGLKGMIILGAGIDIALGVGLAWWIFPSLRVRLTYITVGTVALLLPIFLINFDPDKMASGVYRQGSFLDSAGQKTIFHRDGKTATVSVTVDSKNMTIRTNGKPDASIQTVGGSGYSEDEYTMVLFGALGTILYPEAKTAAVIGWGSGQSTHVLLTSPNLTHVDTIEIEPEMVKAARLFGPRVHLAYDDPRSHLQVEDAKSYFSFYNKKYDLILSEPSNPWVSGVASLYTKEFYSRLGEYLSNNGLFIQWLQLYEIDTPLIASIMNALSPNFSDYVIFAPNATNILIVACKTGTVPDPNPAFLSMKSLTSELQRLNIVGLPDIYVRMIGNKMVFSPFFESYPITSNSDYAPIVDLYAVRSRFYSANTSDLFHNARIDRLPIVQMLGKRPSLSDNSMVTYSNYPRSERIHVANLLHQYFKEGQWRWSHPDQPVREEIMRDAIIAKQVLMHECSQNFIEFEHEWRKAMLHIIANLVPYLSSEKRAELFRYIENPSCASRFTAFQRDFVALLKAVGNQEPLLMVRHSNKLLENEQFEDADLLEYILSAGILGNLSLDNVDEAKLLWINFGKLLPYENRQSMAMRLLVGHIYRQTP
jgi:spermidine synthase